VLAVRLVLFGVMALLGNVLGSALRYPDIGTAVLFPPYAALTAALIVSRRRDWIWFIVVAAAAHFVTHWPQFSLSWVLLADVANIARALVAAALLCGPFASSTRLNGIREFLLFVLAAVVVAPAVGATIGAANVVGHGASDSYARPWIAWFVSNALTGLVMLPACLVVFEGVASRLRRRPQRARVIEAVGLALTLGATCGLAFRGGTGGTLLALPHYAPLLAVIWAALRFGSGGASLAMTAVTLTAIWSADRGTGPFVGSAPDERMLALQIFVLFSSGSMLCLAAIASGRQQALRLYRALLSSLHDHVAILDASGVVMEENGAWRRDFDELAAQDAHDASRLHRVRTGESCLAAYAAAARDGQAQAADILAGITAVLNRDRCHYQVEYDLTRDGRYQSFVMTVEALERPDGGAVITRSDVTARRAAQIEIEERRREVSHLSRVVVLGQLSGAIAHELNQPLAAILSNAEAGRLLLRRTPADLDELESILRDIASEDQRAAAVIRRLRALFRRGEQRVQPVDAHELIDDVLQLAHSELMGHRVMTTTAIDAHVPPFPGDKIQLQQVLLNLILNACDAMSLSPVPDRRLILSAGTDADGQVHLAVRDFGPGIAPELVDRLFEPFVTTKPDGLGLGLSVSRTIVTAHGGRLWAEGHPDGGTTMHSVFPVVAGIPQVRTETPADRQTRSSAHQRAFG
jgi:signal transduction histidine kinase/integral membrane sensor domain MASE1